MKDRPVGKTKTKQKSSIQKQKSKKKARAKRKPTTSKKMKNEPKLPTKTYSSVEENHRDAGINHTKGKKRVSKLPPYFDGFSS